MVNLFVGNPIGPDANPFVIQPFQVVIIAAILIVSCGVLFSVRRKKRKTPPC